MSEYTGKDVSYYLVEIAAPKRLDPYTAECEDIIEALNMTFAEGCAFKAIWRKCAARTLGVAKAGYKGGLYDAEKTQYYGARMVAVEERLSNAPSAEGTAPTTFHERVAEIDKSVQRAIEESLSRQIGETITLGEFCQECGYPTDDAGTHYATCSQLTAPEEYKAEAQVAFEEAAGVADALARQVSAGTQGENYCPQCGAAEGAFRKTDCTVLRRGKSRLGKTLAELRAKQAEKEPAAAMDDDSPRMQAIGQNGEMAAEVYKAVDDPFTGAPDWAEYKAQDMNGQWYWYECAVHSSGSQWVEADKNGRLGEAEGGEPNPNWRDTLITRT